MTARLKNFCKRHQIAYGALEQCGNCEADPGPLPSEVAPEPPLPPKGCIDSHTREAWFTRVANDALADVLRLQATGPSLDAEGETDWHTDVAIKQHRDTAIKAMRAAGELGVAREIDAITEARRREQDEGGSH